MDKTIAVIQKDLSTLRAGRIIPGSGQITVDYYGTHGAEPGGQHLLPEPRMLVIALGGQDDRPIERPSRSPTSASIRPTTAEIICWCPS
ncbi:MAG: hypothetical protein ACLS6G_12875 [Christensenellales bacterium]